jgi:hypothetical protein
MTAATANIVRRGRAQPRRMAIQIANTAVCYHGAVAAMGGRDHGTSATRGRAKPWTGGVNEILLGLFGGSKKTGDTSASPIVETDEIEIDGQIVQALPVTGLAGTVADQGRIVYASDDATFTLTRAAAVAATSAQTPFGVVVRFRTATTADVLVLGLEARIALALAGGEMKTYNFTIAASRTASGNSVTGWVCPVRGRIVGMNAYVVRKAATATLNVAINAEINAVDVTGGVVTWAFADDVGAKLSGTAVTAANVVHEGDLIDIEQAVTGAGAATDVGLINLQMDILADIGV